MNSMYKKEEAFLKSEGIENATITLCYESDGDPCTFIIEYYITNKFDKTLLEVDYWDFTEKTKNI